MRWMSYWELACVQRTITVYPVGQKQGFEEIGAQVTLNSPAFPPSRLLDRVLDSPFRELLPDYKSSAILAVWGVFTRFLPSTRSHRRAG